MFVKCLEDVESSKVLPPHTIPALQQPNPSFDPMFPSWPWVEDLTVLPLGALDSACAAKFDIVA